MIEVPQLRRGAYQFLRQYAAKAWTLEFKGRRWHVRVPPDLAALPEPKRCRTHARREAERLADAELYDVCPQLTSRAVALGAAIRLNNHHDAVQLAGCDNVVATLDIQPPSPTGFLRWRDPEGVSYNRRGAPIIACHWGPVRGGGTWLVWWSDGHVMHQGYTADAKAHAKAPQAGTGSSTPAWTSDISIGMLTMLGPLWYDEQQLLTPHTSDDTSLADPQDEDGTDDDNGKTATETVALLYTTLATWWLLTAPDTGVDLTHQPPSPKDQAADRAAGLRPRPTILASTNHTHPQSGAGPTQSGDPQPEGPT